VAKEIMNKKDLLIEIGTEELPPKALKRLAMAFADELHLGFDKVTLEHGPCEWFATPRRLAVIVRDLQVTQDDRDVERRGPALDAAYDENGVATKAAEGFALSCGVSLEELQTLKTDKGSWLSYSATEKGSAASDLMQEIISAAIGKLPIPKRMRWGMGAAEFVRPVHWILLLFGDEPVSLTLLDVDAGTESYGHRFHHPQAIPLNSSSEYLGKLEKQGKVIVDFVKRQKLIKDEVMSCAELLGGTAIIDPALLNEVTALVEWPVVLSGGFDEQFLELPNEVLIASMQDHQKYFPVISKDGQLLPHFITVANIDSTNPEEISKGNERVIFPRLSDAAFFWRRDITRKLAEYEPGLKDIVYQKQLGSLQDKSIRVANIASNIANTLGLNQDDIKRAALLAKCDLLSDMVGEFPELQGTMGRYYALQSGENADVALAMDEQYMPRFAGDQLPESAIGQALALAEKLDTLLGIFAIGQAPTGDKDPFGLRRAALGCLRIFIECELDLDLQSCLKISVEGFDSSIQANKAVQAVFDFMMERLRRYYADNSISNDVFESVLALRPSNPIDFHRRIQAVSKFTKLPEAQSLAAANKRIQNILIQNNSSETREIDEKLFQEPAENTLASALHDISQSIQPMLDSNDYDNTLSRLAELRDPVDKFFDEVMVMCDDEALKINRLALLSKINTLFLATADISKLQARTL